MSIDRTDFAIPKRIDAFIRRLYIEYRRAGDQTLMDILLNSKVRVNESVSYDGYGDGVHGHDVILLLEAEHFENIPLREQSKIADSIRDDLIVATRSISGETINGVYLELRDESDQKSQTASQPLAAPSIDPADLRFWKQTLSDCSSATATATRTLPTSLLRH